MEVLHYVWELGQATVNDIHARILLHRKVAYTTVMTVMKNLTRKGYLSYTKDGVTYVYHAARSPEDVQHSLLKGVMNKVFKGSPSALVQSLVKHETLSDAERQQLLDLINDLDPDTPND